jgi:hypothetical protein
MRVLTSRELSILAGLPPAVAGHVLHVLAAVPGLTLTSGRRTVERNRAVGGVARSLHLSGRAADFAGSYVALVAGLTFASRFGRAGTASGPTQALIHNSGSGIHLHLAW